jgi:hypothetical protein
MRQVIRRRRFDLPHQENHARYHHHAKNHTHHQPEACQANCRQVDAYLGPVGWRKLARRARRGLPLLLLSFLTAAMAFTRFASPAFRFLYIVQFRWGEF